MKKWQDKLGRELKVGDTVTAARSWGGSALYVGKVYKITDRAVSFRLYANQYSPNWTSGQYHSPYAKIPLSQIKTEEPKSWRQWTQQPQHRLLILRRQK